MATHRKRSGAGDPVPEDSLKPSHVDPPKAPHTPEPRRAASARPVSSAVASPQIGRLERDDQLKQLADQAQGMLSSQDRLRGLLTATRAIAADLGLPVLLRRITEAGCELVGARYGALAVVRPDNQLTDLITVGLDEQTVACIGDLPHGVGILGRLITDPRPLRLEELGSHPESVGFPLGHPPMRTFLGVPIRVRDQVFGSLYVTEKTPGRAFSADDEELLSALAAAAGVAIYNARLYEAAQRRQRWLRVSVEIVGELLAGRSVPLPLIAARARRVADADLALILVEVADKAESLLVAAAEGVGAVEMLGCLVPRDGSLAGQALAEDRDLVVDDASATGREYHSTVSPFGPAVVVPVSAAGVGQLAVLSLSRERGARRFDADERDMAAGFAVHAGLALELAHAQEARRKLLQFEDRDRIARDLHDVVIQRLFATGLGMSALAGRTRDPAARERLGEFTDEVDGSIRAVRQTIFDLQQAGDDAALTAQVLAVVRDVTPGLGCTPDLRLDGPLDTLVSSAVAEHAAAVLREALSNIGRHAEATNVEVSVSVADPHHLIITVTDDGVGLADPQRTSGLANMRSRADQLGGSFTITSPNTPDRRGTRVEWAVPLDSA